MIRREKKRLRNTADSRLGLEVAPTAPTPTTTALATRNHGSPSGLSPSRLLQQLSESCNKHQSSHKSKSLDNTPLENEDEVPSFCREALKILRGLLPRVEKHYHAAEPGHQGPTPLDVRHMCDFYCNVISGGFCVHAPHLFRLGKGASEGM